MTLVRRKRGLRGALAALVFPLLPVPALAGRSPSYLARQLYDFQSGTRKGLWAPLMADVVAELSTDQIVDLTAYLASLEP